jgi:hypothetical protein
LRPLSGRVSGMVPRSEARPADVSLKPARPGIRARKRLNKPEFLIEPGSGALSRIYQGKFTAGRAGVAGRQGCEVP